MRRHAVRGRVLLAIVAAAMLAACDSKTPSPGPASVAPQPSAPSSTSGAPVTTAEPPSTAIAKTPACDLLFKAEVADAIGTKIGDAQEVPSNDEGTAWLTDCIYWDHVAHDRAPFELTLGSGPRFVDIYEDISGLDGVTPVAGLGDTAFVRMATLPSLDGPVGSLFVRSGHVVLGLSLGIVGLRADDGTPQVAGDEAEQTQILTTLATLAWHRLTGPPEVSAKTCALLPAPAAASLVQATFVDAIDVDDHDVWGPSCRYRPGSGPNAQEQWVDLYVAVSSEARARPHFETCRATGAIVPALGDEAFFAASDCVVKFGFFFNENPLMVITGDTVIVVARRGGGQLDGPDGRDKAVAVAHAILAALGASPGATVPPVNADALIHPCALLTQAEVGGIVGATITEPAEFSADASGNNAECFYGTSSSSVTPLTITVGRGAAALNAFTSNVKRDPSFTAVAGLGDEAFQRGTVNETDQPLLVVVVRSGDLVVTVQFGAVRQSADFLSYIAPGTAEQQLEMAKQLLALLMPRVAAG